MAFLTGFVFALVRYGLALIPPLALRVNTKKVAAVVALGGRGLLPCPLGRECRDRAGLRHGRGDAGRGSAGPAGALAALGRHRGASCCWLLQARKPAGARASRCPSPPRSALIVGFATLDRGILRERLPRWALPVFTLVLSSVLGGRGDGPLAAAHFNRFTDYGLLANLLTVPVMGVLIMPRRGGGDAAGPCRSGRARHLDDGAGVGAGSSSSRIGLRGWRGR